MKVGDDIAPMGPITKDGCSKAIVVFNWFEEWWPIIKSAPLYTQLSKQTFPNPWTIRQIIAENYNEL